MSSSGGTRAFALASLILGFTGFGFIIVALLFSSLRFDQLCQRSVVLVYFAPLLALFAILLGIFSRRERGGRYGCTSGGATVGLLIVYAVQIGSPPCGERILWNRRSAIGTLRTINTAEVTYASEYGQGYSPDLASLGRDKGSPSASAAGLIDEGLAKGKISVHVFTYVPGPRDASGKISSYTVVARPMRYDRDDRRLQTSFFTDQSGVICSTDEDRPATA